ncbi:two-component system sensor histidine kinase TctE [Kushneria sinocarnis]|uniref:histidine kinase n=1 Tax=Kushneria sinocarnis TaxID=595502 RepID=A0A420WTE8_9GAMM|nr:sensor histidine kinase [Kushneria sinocarnis]RKQ96383.1 two-component system sensor histidine kinase TctE [Kushneria sinocarnis]
MTLAVATTTSLYRRLLGLMALAMTLLGALLLLQANHSAHQGANRAYDRLLDAASRVLVEQVSWQAGQLRFDVPASALEMLAPGGDERVFYTLVDADGEPISGNVELPPLPADTSASLPGDRDDRFHATTVQWHGMILRLGARQARLAGWQRHDRFSIRVAHTMEARNALAGQLLQGSMLRLGGMALLMLALVTGAVGMALAPLRRLRQALRQRNPDDLSPIALPVPRELRELVGALNDLLARQRRLKAHQQRFIGDASHQLRTPLAGLSSRAELALRSREPEQWHSALVAMQRSATNAARLAGQLLSMSRLQSPDAPTEREAIELRALARASVRQALDRYPGSEIDLGVEACDAPVTVHGSRWQLEEALANLIDNAMHHARHRVTVRVTAQPSRLTVEDDGPGIPSEQRHEVLKPFHGARHSGSGLGLAIVAGICEAHDGQLELHDSEPPPGLSATMRLGAAAESRETAS